MIRLNEKGQSLVEALIALGVATIVVAAMAVAAITAVNNSDFSKYQDLATNYSQEGIEILRQQSQTSWSAFYGKVGQSPNESTYCFAQNATNLADLVAAPTGCATKNINSFFVREVKLIQLPGVPVNDINAPACSGIVQVIVNVSWTDGKCSSGVFCHNVTLKSCLTNINGQ